MKKEWKKGWKVIKKGTRLSCTSGARYEPIKYLKNKKAERLENCGPLAVFETREAARKFVQDNKYGFGAICKIVKCLYVKSVDIKLWEPLWEPYDAPCTETNIRSLQLPSRTAFADSVTCLE